MNKYFLTMSALLIGAGAGYYLSQGSGSSSAEMAEDQPLYWVAPMDPNFKKDKPGLSPMGMDLVPVYAEDLAGGGSPGTVSISPEVINNLGVRTAPVLFSPLQPVLQTVGYIGYDEEQMVDVHSRVQGWIEKLYLKTEGEAVEKGSLLYEIYSPELVNAQEEYLAALQSGNRFLRNASLSKLNALGVTDAVIKQIAKTRKALQLIPVYASQSGVVTRLNVRQGMYIKPATTVMSLASLDQVWVTAELFEHQSGQVSVGDTASMTLDYLPGRQWQGKVDYIYPSLNKKTRTAQIRLRFDNGDDALKPEMFARINIQPQETAANLNVPAEAVIITGTQKRVVVALGEGRFKSVEVATGKRSGDRIAILSGLQPEDQVVVSAQFMLDSESSINSDFLRMTPPTMGIVEEVWVQAEVKELNVSERLITLSHGDIREWQQGSMTMEIPVDDALDLSALSAGMQVQVLLKGANMGELKLTDFILPRPKAPAPTGGSL